VAHYQSSSNTHCCGRPATNVALAFSGPDSERTPLAGTTQERKQASADLEPGQAEVDYIVVVQPTSVRRARIELTSDAG